SSTSKNQDTTKKVKVNQRLQRMIQTTEEREKANQVKKDKKRKRRQAQKLKKKLKTNSTNNHISMEPKDEDEEEEIKQPAEKSIIIRLFPTPQQKQILDGWIGTTRWTYNQCVSLIKEGTNRVKKDLRAATVNNNNFEDENQWVMKTPYDIRNEGMNDVLKAYDSNFAKRKGNPEFKFEIGFRSKKKLVQESFVLHAKHCKVTSTNNHRTIGQLMFYPTFFGSEPLRSAEPIPIEATQYDSRIVKTRLGKYYISISMPLEPKSLSMKLRSQYNVPERIIALDPGVRTFQTGYDPSGACFEWGKNDMGKIMRLGYAIDNIQSRLDTDKTCTGRNKRRLKKAGHRLRLKIKNLIKDCHRKLVKFLCESFDVILLPSFATSQMASKTTTTGKKRKINSDTVRRMMTWSHYSFKQTLISKAREYPWVKVSIVDESYTSKTCTCCGKINDKLGGSKTFLCTSCGTKVDRDFNGARNIFLKNERDLGLYCSGSRCGLAPSDGGFRGNPKSSSQMQEMWISWSEFLWYETQSSL